MEFSCCFCCEDRVPGCHGTCKEYAQAKLKHTARIETLKKQRDKEADSRSYINSHYDRLRK